MIVAKIDRDYINDDDFNRVGMEFHWEANDFPFHKTRFRAKDDDGEVYYGGWLYNDDHGNIQLDVLRWAEADAGCTTIEVKINNEWKQEIG